MTVRLDIDVDEDMGMNKRLSWDGASTATRGTRT
jgi:hypothetical protein